MMLDIPSEEAPMEAGIFGKYRESKGGGGGGGGGVLP